MIFKSTDTVDDLKSRLETDDKFHQEIIPLLRMWEERLEDIEDGERTDEPVLIQMEWCQRSGCTTFPHGNKSETAYVLGEHESTLVPGTRSCWYSQESPGLLVNKEDRLVTGGGIVMVSDSWITGPIDTKSELVRTVVRPDFPLEEFVKFIREILSGIQEEEIQDSVRRHIKSLREEYVLYTVGDKDEPIVFVPQGKEDEVDWGNMPWYSVLSKEEGLPSRVKKQEEWPKWVEERIEKTIRQEHPARLLWEGVVITRVNRFQHLSI